MFHIFANATHLGGDADPEALKTWAAGTIGDTLIWSIPDPTEYEGNVTPVWWQIVTPDGSYLEIVKYPAGVEPTAN